MELEIQDLITEFGAKYENKGQTAADIKKQLFAQDDIMADFKKKPHDNTYYEGVTSNIGEVLQGFIKNFVTKGETSFLPWKQKLGEFKIDTLLSPDELYNTWLGFLADFTESDRSKWPMIQWMIQEMLLPKAAEDFLIEVAWYGWQFTGRSGSESVNGSTFARVVPTGDVALKANTSMDGLRIQFMKMIAESRLTQITTGTLVTDPEDFVSQVEDMYAAVPLVLRSQLDYAYMNPTLAARYRDGIREKYNKNYAQEKDLQGIKDTNITVKETLSMVGSNTIWSTPKKNRVMPVRADKPGRFNIQLFNRDVKLLNSYSYLLTFEQPELIVTNDQGLTIISGETNAGGRYDSGLAGGLEPES